MVDALFIYKEYESEVESYRDCILKINIGDFPAGSEVTSITVVPQLNKMWFFDDEGLEYAEFTLMPALKQTWRHT